MIGRGVAHNTSSTIDIAELKPHCLKRPTTETYYLLSAIVNKIFLCRVMFGKVTVITTHE